MTPERREALYLTLALLVSSGVLLWAMVRDKWPVRFD